MNPAGRDGSHALHRRNDFAKIRCNAAGVRVSLRYGQGENYPILI